MSKGGTLYETGVPTSEDDSVAIKSILNARISKYMCTRTCQIEYCIRLNWYSPENGKESKRPPLHRDGTRDGWQRTARDQLCFPQLAVVTEGQYAGVFRTTFK